MEKFDGPLRPHLVENLTLNDIIGRYTELRLLDDSRTVESRHRANKNFKINNSKYMEVNTLQEPEKDISNNVANSSKPPRN